MLVIDVSKHNGVIDWVKVKNAGVEGAIIRAGYGKSVSQIDPKFISNYNGAKAAGLKVGAYWYSYAVNVVEAHAEAAACINVIKGYQFDFPVYYDMEEDRQVKLNVGLCSEMATVFCERVESAGFWAGVYSFDSFFATNWATTIPDRFAAWVARVPSNDDAKTKVIPKCCKRYGIHQYSWKGKIDGINGDVDLNECTVDYPRLISGVGVNARPATISVTAQINGIDSDTAKHIKEKCEALGMVVVVK